jgi:diguanylate cyclase (GGDEF)-like protein
MTNETTTRSRRERVARFVGRASWVELIAGLALHQYGLSISPQTGQTCLVVALGLFFLLLLTRLALSASVDSSRRAALLLMFGAVLLWSSGSMSVNATSMSDLTTFPANGEFLFLASYGGFAAFLLRDVTRNRDLPLSRWLDVAVIVGGTWCIGSSLMFAPVATESGQHGVALLLALLYPIADFALATLVLSQFVLRARTDLAATAYLGGGLLLIAMADSAFVLHVSASTYDFSNIDDALWGLGFAFLVSGACRVRNTAIEQVPRSYGSWVMLVAGLSAVAALAFRQHGGLEPYVVGGAVLTLCAAGARMAIALRQSNRAAEAFALSQTDDLTLLPNRRAVRQYLDDALAQDHALALFLVDLDGFKDVNDTLGHAAGDTVLRLAAVRMTNALPSDVMVARLGGDEFAVVMHTRNEIALMESARRVLRELGKPVQVDGIELVPSASIGIAVSTDTDVASNDVLRRADVAMYQAKNSRRGAALYDAHNDDFSRSRLLMAETLRKGIAQGQIELWYQPQIEASTLTVRGLEALVRWRHPEQGVLSPVTFLPAARRAGLMGKLSEEVAELAVRDSARLAAAGLDLHIAINVAPPELLSGVFLPRLFAAIERYEVAPERLVVEVTEDSFLSDPDRTRAVLSSLRDRGLSVSIDDYGTGFSSLAYLRDLPVQELKIDRSFVNGISTDSASRMIVWSTNQLAHGLGMRTVAEGVEDAGTASDLIAMGIDVLQGYHFSAPLPPDEVEIWVRDWSTTADMLGSSQRDARDSERWREIRSRDRGRSTRIRGMHRSAEAWQPDL